MTQVASRERQETRASANVKNVDVDLPAEIFDVELNIPLIHQVVVAQQAAARQGTHATKTRGEVRGGGRKPYKQKGTGRARQGSTRAPQFAGGGTVHGPQPRSYDQRTPKKMIAAALRGALSDRARNDRIHVVESLIAAEKPSTRIALAALSTLSKRKRFLVVLERTDSVTWLSLRNAPEVHIVAVDQLNTYDVIVSEDVVFTHGAFEEFIATRSPEPDSRTHIRSVDRAKGGQRVRDAVPDQPHDTRAAPSAAVRELVEPGIGQTSDRSHELDAAHKAARQQMGSVKSYRSTDPTIDGWSVSSEDVEFVAIERHSDHVLITWPSTLSADDAVKLFQQMAKKADAVYANAEDGYVAFDEPGVRVDWTRISKLKGLRFLRAELGPEILVWKAPPDEDLVDNRFQVIEPSVTSRELISLINRTTKRDVVPLLENYLGTGKLDFGPLDAVG